MYKVKQIPINKIIHGNCLDIIKTLPSESVNCIITSPPYWGLRDYGHDDQLGLEKTPEEYIQNLVAIFQEARRVLRDDGTLWLNIGDSYASGGSSADSIHKKRNNYINHKAKDRSVARWGGGQNKVLGLRPKELVGIPWRVAFALQSDGWILRQDIIWNKPNPMPESVKDRCTKSHEYIFLLTKNQRYYFDNEAIKEKAVWDLDGNGTIKRAERQREGLKSNPTEMKNGIRITYPNGKHKDGQQSPKFINGKRNKRSVWTVTTKPFKQVHFATFPEELIIPMVLAGCPEKGIILDPFFGSGTTGLVAKKHSRNYIGIELNQEYIQIAEKRLAQGVLF
jgi:DNA modification methylase